MCTNCANLEIDMLKAKWTALLTRWLAVIGVVVALVVGLYFASRTRIPAATITLRGSNGDLTEEIRSGIAALPVTSRVPGGDLTEIVKARSIHIENDWTGLSPVGPTEA